MLESARAITTAPAHPLRFYNKHGPTLVVHRPPHQKGGLHGTATTSGRRQLTSGLRLWCAALFDREPLQSNRKLWKSGACQCGCI